MPRKKTKCQKDVFGFCKPIHQVYWRHAGGSSGNPGGSDKPNEPNEPIEPNELTAADSFPPSVAPVARVQLGSRTLGEMSAEDQEGAHLIEAARQNEIGGDADTYLAENAPDWTMDRGLSYDKGAVFVKNGRAKLAYTGTDVLKPADLDADSSILDGTFRSSSGPDHPELVRATKLATEARIKYPVDEILGYSLGGAKAQSVGAYNGLPTRLYNPGLGPGHVADQGTNFRPPSTRIVKTKGDPVSILTGQLEKQGAVTVNEIPPLTKHTTALARHGSDNFYDEESPRLRAPASELNEARLLDKAILARQTGASYDMWATHAKDIPQARREAIWAASGRSPEAEFESKENFEAAGDGSYGSTGETQPLMEPASDALATPEPQLDAIAGMDNAARASHIESMGAPESSSMMISSNLTNVGAGFAAGMLGGEIANLAMKAPSAQRWNAMSQHQKNSFRQRKEALSGGVGAGLAGGAASLLTGASALAIAPEIALGSGAAVVGGEVGHETTKLMEHAGVSRGVSEFTGSTVGGGTGGAALGGGAVALSSASSAISSAVTSTAAASGAGIELVGAGGAAAGEAAPLLAGAAAAAGAEEGGTIGAFFAPETAGLSVALGAAVGAGLGAVSYEFGKLFHHHKH